MSGEPVTSTILTKWIALTLWSAIGGTTHALIQQRKGNVKNFVDGCILAVISGFAGMMWALIAIKFQQDVTVIAFAAGMGGFMSVEGLVLLINTLKAKYLK